MHRELIHARPILLSVRLDGEAVVQKKLRVALLPIRVHHLLPLRQRPERRHREAALRIVKGPARLSRAKVIEHIRPRHHRGALLPGDSDRKVPRADRSAAPEKLIEREPIKPLELGADRVVIVANIRNPRASLGDEIRSFQELKLLFGPKDGKVVKCGGEDVVERLEERVAALHPLEDVHDDVVVVRRRELILNLLQLGTRRRRARRRVRDEALERDRHDLRARRHDASRVYAANVRLIALQVEVRKVRAVRDEPLQKDLKLCALLVRHTRHALHHRGVRELLAVRVVTFD
tara:strand:- start:229 stop:1101 length:873 start_codon:yes stop_codon:yes gene_type:complete